MDHLIGKNWMARLACCHALIGVTCVQLCFNPSAQSFAGETLTALPRLVMALPLPPSMRSAVGPDTPLPKMSEYTATTHFFGRWSWAPEGVCQHTLDTWTLTSLNGVDDFQGLWVRFSLVVLRHNCFGPGNNGIRVL